MMTTDEMIKYDMTVDIGIATAEEINLVRSILAGSWTEVLDSICYARTGYRDLDQYMEYEDEDKE